MDRDQHRRAQSALLPSTLASWLVTAGHLTPRQVRRALTSQVLYGGTLDTVLLEERLVDERALLSLLAEAIGCAPMSADLLDYVSGEVAELVPAARALPLGVTPVAEDGQRLLLLVTQNTDLVAVDELAFDVGREALPLAATELRAQQVASRIYRLPLEQRFRELIALHGDRPGKQPTSRTLRNASPAKRAVLACLDRLTSEERTIVIQQWRDRLH